MQTTGLKPRITPLLDNDAVARLERLRINAAGRFTSRLRGEHLSGKGGASMEFADYRDYVEGDDTRFVDWNIFARLRRPYLKQFHLEEERHLAILVDASASMKFEQKAERARQLAAACAICGLFGNEPVSVYAFNRGGSQGESKQPMFAGPWRGRGNLRRILRFIEGIEPGGMRPVEAEVDQMLRTHRGRGVGLVISDFLTFTDLLKTFNALHGAGLEPMALQVLAPTELEPDVASDLRLVDSETGQMLDVTAAGDLFGLYQQHLENYQRRLQGLAQQRGGRFLCVSSGEPIEKVLFDTLRRRGWLA